MATTSPSGFARRHIAVRKTREFSQVQLSYAMYDADREERRGYDPSFIARVERDERTPPYRYWLLLGRVLRPSLEELPEYHLAMARAQLDERQVGVEQALANLESIGGASLVDSLAELRAGVEASTDQMIGVAAGEASSPRSRPETARKTSASKGSARKGA